jgi:hypothetical protein
MPTFRRETVPSSSGRQYVLLNVGIYLHVHMALQPKDQPQHLHCQNLKPHLLWILSYTKYSLFLLQTVKKTNWRQKHEDFINSIRGAKEMKAHIAKGGKLSDLPPPPPSDYSDYVQCPHCSRRFNQHVAERHIPKCANFQFNKPKPQQTGRGTPHKGAVPRKRWWGNQVFSGTYLWRESLPTENFLQTSSYRNSGYNFNRSEFNTRSLKLHSTSL